MEKADLEDKLQTLEPVIKSMVAIREEHYLKLEGRTATGRVNDDEAVLKAGMIALYGGAGRVDEALFLNGSLKFEVWGSLFETQYQRKVGTFGDLLPLQQTTLDCAATLKAIVPVNKEPRSRKDRSEAQKLIKRIEGKLKDSALSDDDLVKKMVEHREKLVSKIAELDGPKLT